METMKTLKELKPLILEWAKEKNLLVAENAPKQRLKLIEECGELASAILKNDVKEQKDAIGDIFVVLVILAEQLETDLNFELINYSTGKADKDLYDIIDMVFMGNLDFCVSDIYYLAKSLNHDLTECVNLAWNTIKDRTGKTLNGIFIKD